MLDAYYLVQIREDRTIVERLTRRGGLQARSYADGDPVIECYGRREQTQEKALNGFRELLEIEAI